MEIDSISSGLSFNSVKLSKKDSSSANRYIKMYLKNGSEDSKMALLRLYDKQMVKSATRQTKTKWQFQDLLQDMKLNLLRGLEQIKPNIANPSFYLTAEINKTKPKNDIFNNSGRLKVERLDLLPE